MLYIRVDVDDSRRHGENHLAANPPGSNPLAVGVGKGQLGVINLNGYIATVM